MSRHIGVAHGMRTTGGLVQLLLLLLGMALSSRVLDPQPVSSKQSGDPKKAVADLPKTLGGGGSLLAAAGAPPKPTLPRGKKKAHREAVDVQSEAAVSREGAEKSGESGIEGGGAPNGKGVRDMQPEVPKSRKEKTVSSRAKAATIGIASSTEQALPTSPTPAPSPSNDYEQAEDASEENEDGDAGGILSEDDSEWVAFKAALLGKLAAANQSLTIGKLGHELHAFRRVVAAALWQLEKAGAVTRSKEKGIPPIFSVVPGASLNATPAVATRYAYDETKKKKKSPGPKASKEDFETLKLLVRKSIASKGANGSTARALGNELKVSKRLINAALYVCGKEGTAWTLTEKGSGTKLRWAAKDAICEKPMPTCYLKGGLGGPLAVAPKGEIEQDTTDSFAQLKLLLWGIVAAQGGDGVTSGVLGYALAAKPKAITAALYSLVEEGVIKKIADERSKPKWVSVVKPPVHAARTSFPSRFAYKGRNASEAAVRGAAHVKEARKLKGMTTSAGSLRVPRRRKGTSLSRTRAKAPVADSSAV